jgi:hypothetical protein
MIIAILLCTLLISTLTAGYKSSTLITFIFYFKKWSHPFYNLGLTFHREVYEDCVMDVFTIGTFFFNFEIEFKKPL